jgi:hypothetical protein
LEDVRDHAIIQVFTEGVRLTELAQMEICNLSADLIARPFAWMVPLKGARLQRGADRLVHAGDRAFAAYLRLHGDRRHPARRVRSRLLRSNPATTVAPDEFRKLL